MRKFNKLTLKEGRSLADQQSIMSIDYHYLRCVFITYLELIKVYLIKKVNEGKNPRLITMKPKQFYSSAYFICPIQSSTKYNTLRF